MKKALSVAALLAASTGIAQAGGIDRSGQFLRPLFEEGGETGSYAEFSFASVSPRAGNDVFPADPLDSFQPYSFALKQDINEQFSFALILDQPFGADVDYRPFLPLNIGHADIETQALTGVVRYKFNENFSVHGGLRAQQIGGEISTFIGGAIPASLVADSDFDIGALVGVTYERPDIALRVSLTYNSEIDHDMTGVETIIGGAPAASNFEVTTPASINLTWQTGIAADTLLFGSIRHVEWEGFNLTNATGQYVNFREDTQTFSLGLGRRFNENWSGAVTYTYESPGIRPTDTLLNPTTGINSIGVGVTYTQGNTKVTGGITYARPGDQFGFVPGPAQINFNDTDTFAAGIRIGFNF